MPDMDRLVQDLNKSYGGTKIIIKKASELPPLRTFSLGIPTLDFDLGGGCLWGRTIIVAGNAGTGKTSLAYKAVAQAQKLGITVIWFDLEKAFDRERAKKFGVDPDLVWVVSSDEMTAENVFAMLRDSIRAVKAQEDSRAMFVVDSIAGMQIENLFEKDAGNTMGGNAKAVNQSITVWNLLLAENQILFLINELRDKIGSMGEPDMMPGGRAQEFISSQTLWTRAGQTIKDGADAIGQELKWTIKKSRSSAPKEVGLINYLYDTGFEYTENLIAVAIEMGIIEQAGAWFTALGERFHGQKALNEKLSLEKEFIANLAKEVYDKMPIPNWDGIINKPDEE